MRFRVQYIAGLLLMSVCLLAATSCKKVFDLSPEDTLDSENMYRNVYDADAAVMGIYGRLQTLAATYVILNELRADLLEATPNADGYLREIELHQVSADNPYADPRPFYTVIYYCNDALENFNRMLSEKRLTQSEYNARYADVGAVRSWLYLQLGIHYGDVPYVTSTFADVNELKDSSKFPRLNFKDLLRELIAFTTALPSLDPYPTTESLNTTLDGVETERFFINKRIVLGDLYLWNDNYTEAATSYKTVIESYSNAASTDERLNFYKVWWADVANNNDLAVGYLRYREQDQHTLINSSSQGWKSMFIRPRDNIWRSEWIWAIPFNKNFAPENPFISLFALNGGRYQLKPSAKAIGNWSSQTQLNGAPYDARGLFTFTLEGNNPVIYKYIYHYDPLVPLEKEGNWFLYRAALLHLHYAEAANRDGKGKIAWGLVNTGIGSVYPDTKLSEEPAPYDMDARGGTGASYYGSWYRNTGIRNRAYLTPLDTLLQEDRQGLENAIVDEAALELAYEGNRWPDLLRIALRRFPADPGYLADKVAAKFEAAGNGSAAAGIRTRLANKANWYLPFDWK